MSNARDDSGGFVTITPRSDGGWDVEGSNPILCKMNTRGQANIRKVGLFVMPFKLTLHELP